MQLYACTWPDCMRSVPNIESLGIPQRDTSGCRQVKSPGQADDSFVIPVTAYLFLTQPLFRRRFATLTGRELTGSTLIALSLIRILSPALLFPTLKPCVTVFKILPLYRHRAIGYNSLYCTMNYVTFFIKF